jgi:hypothetical protein
MKIFYQLSLLFFLFVSSNSSYFAQPKTQRPRKVKLHHIQGVLTSYGIGNKSTTFSVLLQNGKEIIFEMKSPNLIDGKHWNCLVPPSVGCAVDTSHCKEWPSYLFMGKSTVTVTYWIEKIKGQLYKISDQIIVVRDSINIK